MRRRLCRVREETVSNHGKQRFRSASPDDLLCGRECLIRDRPEMLAELDVDPDDRVQFRPVRRGHRDPTSEEVAGRGVQSLEVKRLDPAVS